MQPTVKTNISPAALGMTDMNQVQVDNIRTDYKNRQAEADRKMQVELGKFEALLKEQAARGKGSTDIASTLAEKEKKPTLSQTTHMAQSSVVPASASNKNQSAGGARSFASVVPSTTFVLKEFEQYAEDDEFHQGGAIFARKG